MNIAVEDAENDVNSDESSQDEDRFVREQTKKGRRRALEGRLNADGHVQFGLALLMASTASPRAVPEQDCRTDSIKQKLSLMVDSYARWRRAQNAQSAGVNPWAGSRSNVCLSVR